LIVPTTSPTTPDIAARINVTSPKLNRSRDLFYRILGEVSGRAVVREK
jgi:hypothetical protein